MTRNQQIRPNGYYNDPYYDPYYLKIPRFRSKVLPKVFDSKGNQIKPEDSVCFFINEKKAEGVVCDMGDFFDTNNPDPKVKIRISKTRSIKVKASDLFLIKNSDQKIIWQQDGF